MPSGDSELINGVTLTNSCITVAKQVGSIFLKERTIMFSKENLHGIQNKLMFQIQGLFTCSHTNIGIALHYFPVTPL